MIFSGKQVKTEGKSAVQPVAAKANSLAGAIRAAQVKAAAQRPAVGRPRSAAKPRPSSLDLAKAAAAQPGNETLAVAPAGKAAAQTPPGAPAAALGTLAPDSPLLTKWQDGLIAPGNTPSRSPSSSYWW